MLLMEEVLHQLIGSLSQVLYIPGGEEFLPSTVSVDCQRLCFTRVLWSLSSSDILIGLEVSILRSRRSLSYKCHRHVAFKSETMKLVCGLRIQYSNDTQLFREVFNQK